MDDADDFFWIPELTPLETLRGWIETPRNVYEVIEATRRGILNRVCHRLKDADREQIRSGSIFVWEQAESEIIRWTDGRLWSASRVEGTTGFLVYREVSPRHGFVNSSSSPRAVTFEEFERSRLRKKVTCVIGPDERKYHLAFYFKEDDVEMLRQMMEKTKLRELDLDENGYQHKSPLSSRKAKAKVTRSSPVSPSSKAKKRTKVSPGNGQRRSLDTQASVSVVPLALFSPERSGESRRKSSSASQSISGTFPRSDTTPTSPVRIHNRLHQMPDDPGAPSANFWTQDELEPDECSVGGGRSRLEWLGTSTANSSERYSSGPAEYLLSDARECDLTPTHFEGARSPRSPGYSCSCEPSPPGHPRRPPPLYHPRDIRNDYERYGHPPNMTWTSPRHSHYGRDRQLSSSETEIRYNQGRSHWPHSRSDDSRARQVQLAPEEACRVSEELSSPLSPVRNAPLPAHDDRYDYFPNILSADGHLAAPLSMLEQRSPTSSPFRMRVVSHAEEMDESNRHRHAEHGSRCFGRDPRSVLAPHYASLPDTSPAVSPVSRLASTERTRGLPFQSGGIRDSRDHIREVQYRQPLDAAKDYSLGTTTRRQQGAVNPAVSMSDGDVVRDGGYLTSVKVEKDEEASLEGPQPALKPARKIRMWSSTTHRATAGDFAPLPVESLNYPGRQLVDRYFLGKLDKTAAARSSARSDRGFLPTSTEQRPQCV